MKIGLWGAALVLMAALLYFAFCAPISTRVLSSSMEPTLYGPRWEPVCPRCGDHFIFSVDNPTREKVVSLRFASCPVCGFSEVPLDPKEFRDPKCHPKSRVRAKIARQWSLTVKPATS